ncbi:MAG: hypothetical protein WCK90_01780 [archaeon]
MIKSKRSSRRMSRDEGRRNGADVLLEAFERSQRERKRTGRPIENRYLGLGHNYIQRVCRGFYRPGMYDNPLVAVVDYLTESR